MDDPLGFTSLHVTHQTNPTQDQAVHAIANCVRLSRAGLRAHDRPVGVFLFLGPTGVGKTHLTKKVTEFLFNDERAMVRLCFDVIEESLAHHVSGWDFTILFWRGLDDEIKR